MKFYFYLLAIIYSASLFGACPAMRKNSYKSSSASYASPARYVTPAKAYNPNDPKNYKFSVNEDKFKIYNARFSGLFNAYINKKSWYRPFVKVN